MPVLADACMRDDEKVGDVTWPNEEKEKQQG